MFIGNEILEPPARLGRVELNLNFKSQSCSTRPNRVDICLSRAIKMSLLPEWRMSDRFVLRTQAVFPLRLAAFTVIYVFFGRESFLVCLFKFQ